MKSGTVGLPEALERAATALPDRADAIRPANGDPVSLAELLGEGPSAEVLAWLLVNEPVAGGELAEAWAEDPEGVGRALLAVEQEGLPKAGLKALRRAHHRLRSHGVELAPASPRQRVATLPPVADELTAALVTPIDPGGARVAYLVEPHPGGGARMFELMLDDERGVLNLEVYNAGRSQVRRFLRDASRRKQFAATPVPPDALRALIGRIAAEQPSGRPLPRGFAEWRSRVAVAPEGTATPGELARGELGGEPSDERRNRALELVRQRELGPWPPESKALAAVAEKLDEIAKGQIIVSGGHRRSQVEATLAEAALTLFDAPFAAHTARRFEETAYVWWKAGRDEDARACLVAADDLRAGVDADHALARALLEVVFAPLLTEIEGQEEKGKQEPSLLVTP